VLNHLNEYKNKSDDNTPGANTPPMDPTTNTTSHANNSSQVTNHHGNYVMLKKLSTSKHNNETRVGQTNASRSRSKNEGTTTPQTSKWRNINIAALPLDDPEKHPVGLLFTDIGKNSQFIEIAENHARKCFIFSSITFLIFSYPSGLHLHQQNLCSFVLD